MAPKRECGRIRITRHNLELDRDGILVKRSLGRTGGEAASAYDLSVWGFNYNGDILAIRAPLADLHWFPRPFAYRTNRPYNISFHERPTSILATPDFGSVLMVEANQEYSSVSATRSDPDGNVLSILADAYIRLRKLALFGPRDSRIDLVPV